MYYIDSCLLICLHDTFVLCQFGELFTEVKGSKLMYSITTSCQHTKLLHYVMHFYTIVKLHWAKNLKEWSIGAKFNTSACIVSLKSTGFKENISIIYTVQCSRFCCNKVVNRLIIGKYLYWIPLQFINQNYTLGILLNHSFS